MLQAASTRVLFLSCAHTRALWLHSGAAAACAVTQETEHWKMCSLIWGGCVGQTLLGGLSFSAGAQLFTGGRKEPRTPPITTWCWSRALSDMPLPPVYTLNVQNNIIYI